MARTVRCLGILALLVVVTAAGRSVLVDAPVAEAAARGDLTEVRELLRSGADVNEAQGDGMTALHWASLRGDAGMVSVLLYAGANPEATTRLGAYTPLHLAAREGRSEVARLLLEGGSAVDPPTTTGATPLHLAAGTSSVGVVDALLSSGAEVDAREDKHGQTPLIFAAADGRLAVVRALIEGGADVAAASNVVDFVERAQLDSEARGRRREVQAAIRKAEAEARGETIDPGSVTRTDTPSGQEPTRREAADRAQRDGQAADADSTAASASEEPTSADSEEPETEDPEAEPESKPEPPTGQGAGTNPADDTSANRSEETPATAAAPAPRPLGYSDLVGQQGGMNALHYAAREGYADVVDALLHAGADLNQPTDGDHSTPMLIAIINGHYDLAADLLSRGADSNLASEDGVAPLYATVANRWAPKALYPQPTAFRQQELDYLELMELLLAKGADPNRRVNTHIWYSAYNFDLLGVNFSGATPFWRAAKALDIPAMRLLVAAGADPHIPTRKTPSRRRRSSNNNEEDPSGLPPVEVGGPGIPALVAAAGYGYGRSRTGNQHRHAPDSWLVTAKYLVEELGADVHGRDSDGFGALHYAAARGDNELIEYLVGKGADPLIVARSGQTTVDMANGPIQRVQPFFETIALLEGMGAKNNNKCLSC